MVLDGFCPASHRALPQSSSTEGLVDTSQELCFVCFVLWSRMSSPYRKEDPAVGIPEVS